jgi:hypothetical protein
MNPCITAPSNGSLIFLSHFVYLKKRNMNIYRLKVAFRWLHHPGAYRDLQIITSWPTVHRPQLLRRVHPPFTRLNLVSIELVITDLSTGYCFTLHGVFFSKIIHLISLREADYCSPDIFMSKRLLVLQPRHLTQSAVTKPELYIYNASN